MATGKKHIKGRKEVNLTDSNEKKQGMCPTEEWKEKGHKLGTVGHMCEAHKNKELEVLDKKRQELTEKVVELGKKSGDTKEELQVILPKENSQMWDRIEVFERYAEQERALRIQAVNLSRRYEEKILGRTKKNDPERITHPESKRPRINMMRAEERPVQEEVDQKIRELIEKEEAIKREFDLTQEENVMKQRRFNIPNTSAIEKIQSHD